QGLCPERDFKVEGGGFCERPVCGLKHVPGTSLLVTSGPPASSLQLWQLAAEDSDVIKPVGSILTANSGGEEWAKMATTATRAPWVLHGSRLSNIHVTEVESRKNIYVAGSGSSEELSTVAFLGSPVVLLCCSAGRLCLADLRRPHGPEEAAPVP
ncbi:WDR73 protein, partial [Penelope pileata]|nr:WDR73 protein [Penelope pileata]